MVSKILDFREGGYILNSVPKGERKHIAIFGKTNTGKSSLINFLTNQNLSIVSDKEGTTTDPVYKNMEIIGLGACTLIDTAGFDDTTDLSYERMEKTETALLKTDLAILVFSDDDFSTEKKWVEKFKYLEIPFICVLNKIDLIKEQDILATKILNDFGVNPILISCKEKIGFEDLIYTIKSNFKDEIEMEITGELVKENDVVLLVMPQDKQAPKGRLILPQVQVLRELLDKKCTVISTSLKDISNALKSLSKSPDVIITDSQIFKEVYDQKPDNSKMTSFSVLFAGYKGDIDYYLESVKILENLKGNANIIISEACTHNAIDGDIGREKIPNLLRKKFGNDINITVVTGDNLPKDLENYDLIIQCGACMFNRKYVLNRINMAKDKSIPVTNYGIIIAYLNGILDKINI